MGVWTGRLLAFFRDFGFEGWGLGRGEISIPWMAPLSSIVLLPSPCFSLLSAAARRPMNLFLGCLGVSCFSASRPTVTDSPRFVLARSSSIF